MLRRFTSKSNVSNRTWEEDTNEASSSSLQLTIGMVREVEFVTVSMDILRWEWHTDNKWLAWDLRLKPKKDMMSLKSFKNMRERYGSHCPLSEDGLDILLESWTIGVFSWLHSVLILQNGTHFLFLYIGIYSKSMGHKRHKKRNADGGTWQSRKRNYMYREPLMTNYKWDTAKRYSVSIFTFCLLYVGIGT